MHFRQQNGGDKPSIQHNAINTHNPFGVGQLRTKQISDFPYENTIDNDTQELRQSATWGQQSKSRNNNASKTHHATIHIQNIFSAQNLARQKQSQNPIYRSQDLSGINQRSPNLHQGLIKQQMQPEVEVNAYQTSFN